MVCWDFFYQVVASEFINKASSSSVVRATVDIEPETTTTNGAVISSQFIWSVLTGAVGDVIPGYGLFDSVESISRPPVCGNQLCETGEREIYTKNVDGSKALVAGGYPFLDQCVCIHSCVFNAVRDSANSRTFQ